MATHALSELPTLNSNPGAPAQLYLDFDGAPAEKWSTYSVPLTSAYDQDADSSSFSDSELTSIQEIWARVAEKFSPFNINVTTVDPGTYPDRGALRVVIGGNGTWTGSKPGGISKIGSFYNLLANAVYVFPANLGNGNPKYLAEAIAHETGHSFGLIHQSVYSGTQLTNQYNPGDGKHAPIMGNSYSSIRGLWWTGPSSNGSTALQDDLAVISSPDNAFGYRPDDHGNDSAHADPATVSGTSVSASGIIERMTDADYFSFTTDSGSVSFTVNVAQYGPMLHAKAEIRDANDNVIASAANANTLGQTFSANLAAGTYYLVVRSYGEYGDLGQYTVTGTLPTGGPVLPEANAGGPYAVPEGGTIQLNGSASTGTNLTYAWDLDGDGLFGEIGANALHGDETGPTPIFRATGLDGPSTYPIKLKVTDASNNTSTAALNITVSNVPPTPSFSGAASAKQDTTYTLNLSSTDAGPDTISQWIINWGDGSSDTITDGRTSLDHVYTARGPYTITGSATDEDGTYAANTLDVTVRSPYPAATVNPAAITTFAGSTYDFTVVYADDLGINPATLDDNDLRVTGPNDFDQLAILVSATNDAAKGTCTAIYRIAAPGGSWEASDNGTYTLTLQADQVANTAGDLALSSVLATLLVNAPALPAANAGGPYTVAEGSTIQLDGSASTGLDLTYAWDLDGDGIFGETGANALHGDETGPTPTFEAISLDGPSIYSVTLKATDSANNTATTTIDIVITNTPPLLAISGANSAKVGTNYTLNLSASDPGLDTISKWIILWGDGSSEEITDGRTTVPHTYTTRGQYTITASAIDDDGTYLANSLTVAVKRPFPRATTSPDDIIVAGGLAQQFTVVYADDFGLDDATLDSADILVTGPNGFSQFATFVSAEEDLNTGSYIAVYQIEAPDGAWNPADNGTYTVALQDGQVSNLVGYAAPAAALASFEVAIPETDITPPSSTVMASGFTYGGGTSYTFSVTYRDEVALNIAALDGNEIVVRGPNRYRQSASLVSKSPSADGKSCRVTYRITAPGGFWDPADNGNYWFQVNAGQVTDAAANAMPAGALSTTINVNIADDGAGTLLKRSKLLKLPAPGKSRTQSGFLIGTNTEDYYWFSVTIQTRLNAALSNMVGNAKLQILNKSGRVVQPIRKYASDPHAFSNTLTPGIYYIRIARIGTPSTGYDLQLSTALIAASPIVTPAKSSAFSIQPLAANTATPARNALLLAANSARPTSLFSTEGLQRTVSAHGGQPSGPGIGLPQSLVTQGFEQI